MTTEQSVLLKLIRQSQFDTVEDIAWDEIDLDALYEEASQQAVLGLIAPLIPEAYSNDTWRKAQLQQEASYIRYCFAQDELKKILDDAGVPFVILKGNAAAIYYKQPMRRAMGDIDFLVPLSHIELTKHLMISKKYIEDHSDNRHISFRKNGICFELHHRYSSVIDIEQHLIDGMKDIHIGIIDEHNFPMLPPLSNGLSLLEHMRKHLITGLGLRQVIDWMMYVKNNLNDSFWNNHFRIVAIEKELDALAMVATRMCQLYLGLDDSITWCKSADTDDCNEMLEMLLISGNFGCKNGKGNNIESVSTSIKRFGLFHWLQHSGESSWNAYQKHHWLKPFCWIYQSFRYMKKTILFGRNAKQIKSDFERSKRRYKLLNKLHIK